ncbi:hypothetical protein HUT16_03080 [Kitasatospora sp. NA04385]|uniref:hypothetical protein n=1 Tax=Kitasatospora sp. NA04385 TaxID=2742135 RepID=UPI0015914CDE|nr:hypothetical protein [Kitasatospora sp. NA04385]QKW18179.1 hypothetical protein HUT16_03080 [Kitasatospora sp. NA04385]
MEERPRLTQQDLADFEYAVGQALARLLPSGDPAAARLRVLARAARAGILAAAAEEYREYARLRAAAAARVPAPAVGRSPGWADVLAVIVPIVAGGTAGVLFLLSLLFSAVDGSSGPGDALATASLDALLVAVAGAATGAVVLAVTAARRRPPVQDTADGDRLVEARLRWRTALLEGGLLPFLLDHLADPPPGSRAPAFRPRLPSPDFTGPDYSSPDFSGPDYTGPGFDTGTRR